MKPKISLTKQPKIAIVHDYFIQYGGAEKVLEALHNIWPNASIYTSFVDKKVLSFLEITRKNIKASLLSKVPLSYKFYKHFVPAYPIYFRSINFEDYDVVVSSSTFAAKFINPRKAVHICYLHTVPRFLWGYETELKEPEVLFFDKYFRSIYKKTTPIIKDMIRKVDYNSAQKVDFFITNSAEVQKRVKKQYGRDSYVIYPPVDTARFIHFRKQRAENREQNYFLVVSRLGGYKKVNIVVEAFNRLGLSLKVVGAGPQFEYLRSIAKKNVQMLGRLPDHDVTNLIQNCKALIFPTHEDFGIVPVEAMAAGKPVIAYGKGGALETVVGGVTGEFFDRQTPSAIINEIKKFNPKKYKLEACRRQALKFSEGKFKRKIKFFVEEAYAAKRIA